MRKILPILILFFCSQAWADCVTPKTYYVRPDGGTSTQCTGLVDSPYSGSGTGQACAWKHPNWAIYPKTGTSPFKGCDTLIVKKASYKLGYYNDAGGANENVSGRCSTASAWDCTLQAIPDGTAENPTRILGEGWDQGCPSSLKPDFWGSGRLGFLLNITGSDNIEIQCLELTDHRMCMNVATNVGGSQWGCPESSPYTDNGYVRDGIFGPNPSNVLIKNVHIHGVGMYGTHTSKISNFTISDSIIEGTGDSPFAINISTTDNSSSGTNSIIRSRLEYGGCVEEYPIVHTGSDKFDYCGAQNHVGWVADGVELGPIVTGAGDWVITDSSISYNTHDGLDLLYKRGFGTTKIKRSRFINNQGNQVKVASDLHIEDSKLIGRCTYFHPQRSNKRCSIGHGCTSNGGLYCRGQGAPLAWAIWKTGQQLELINNLILGESDVLVLISQGTTSINCDGTEKIYSRNSISLGQDSWEANNNSSQFLYWPADDTDDYYFGGTDGNGSGSCGSGSATKPALDLDYDLYENFKPPFPPASATMKNGDPGLTGLTVVIGGSVPATSTWECATDECDSTFLPASNSTVRDFGLTSGFTATIDTVDNLDLYNNARGSYWDLGPLDFGSSTTTICGNGVIEGSEECDDGNTTAGDGCSATCTTESHQPVCGDGIQETPEECDDGNTTNDDGCSASCIVETLAGSFRMRIDLIGVSNINVQ